MQRQPFIRITFGNIHIEVFGHAAVIFERDFLNADLFGSTIRRVTCRPKLHISWRIVAPKCLSPEMMCILF